MAAVVARDTNSAMFDVTGRLTVELCAKVETLVLCWQ
jgi:hypothetical protein